VRDYIVGILVRILVENREITPFYIHERGYTPHISTLRGITILPTLEREVPTQGISMPRTVIIGAGIIGVSTAYYLSHSASKTGHTVTILDPCPPASGASGKAAGFLSRAWTGEQTSSLEELSFRLYKELADRYEGTERWGYRQCNVLAVVAGKATHSSENVSRNEPRLKRLRSTVYSGELSWLKTAVIESQSLLGDAGSFAQWYI